VLFFTDEGAFREFVRLLGADGTIPAEVLLGDLGQGKVINIDKDTPVRVVERLEGGAKVTVTSGPFAGKVGWMLANALPGELPGGQPYGTDA
jgi:hypothetical protein